MYRVFHRFFYKLHDIFYERDKTKISYKLEVSISYVYLILLRISNFYSNLVLILPRRNAFDILQKSQRNHFKCFKENLTSKRFFYTFSKLKSFSNDESTIEWKILGRT